MIGKRIITTFVVLTLFMSVLIVVNRQMTAEAMWLNDGYTPGYNHWGNSTNRKISYHESTLQAIEINTSGLLGSTEYNVFAPYYNNSLATPSVFEWTGKTVSQSQVVSFTTAADPGSPGSWKTATLFPSFVTIASLYKRSTQRLS